MKMQAVKILVLIIYILFISSCQLSQTQDSSKEASFELLYPNCAMNSTVQFLPLQENYKFGDNIVLSSKNYSEEQIVFPPDSGVKILAYEQNDSQWIEVKNKMKYAVSPEPYLIVGPSDERSSYSSIVISPDISNNQSLEIRVTIIGHVYRDSIVTDECVGAFIDISP